MSLSVTCHPTIPRPSQLPPSPAQLPPSLRDHPLPYRSLPVDDRRPLHLTPFQDSNQIPPPAPSLCARPYLVHRTDPHRRHGENLAGSGLWEEVVLAERWWGVGLSIFGDPRVREECLGSFEGGEEGASGGFTCGGEEEVGRDEELYRREYRHQGQLPSLHSTNLSQTRSCLHPGVMISLATYRARSRKRSSSAHVSSPPTCSPPTTNRPLGRH
jgi:hypothetical protein